MFFVRVEFTYVKIIAQYWHIVNLQYILSTDIIINKHSNLSKRDLRT